MSAVPAPLRALPEQTMELSGDIIAFDEDRALAVTAEYLHPRYWEDLEVDPRWWVIGESGTGDQWLCGPDGAVWFFDHNHGERAPHLFDAVGLTVTEWLILGHALGRFENLDSPTDDDVARLDALLDSISPGLADRYPYDLPYA